MPSSQVMGCSSARLAGGFIRLVGSAGLLIMVTTTTRLFEAADFGPQGRLRTHIMAHVGSPWRRESLPVSMEGSVASMGEGEVFVEASGAAEQRPKRVRSADIRCDEYQFDPSGCCGTRC